jgi:hypothetical protein
MPGGIALADFDKTHTGYTNKYLEKRNDLKTKYLFKDDIMYKEDKAPDQNYSYSIFKDLEKTPLMNMFFSQKNVDYLQEMMKKIVYKETGHVIGDQSVPDLLIIMRARYLSDSKNLPYDMARQIAELNWLVLKYAVYDQILPKVKGYNIFLNDNLRTNVILPRDKYISNKGAKINRGFADLI